MTKTASAARFFKYNKNTTPPRPISRVHLPPPSSTPPLVAPVDFRVGDRFFPLPTAPRLLRTAPLEQCSTAPRTWSGFLHCQRSLDTTHLGPVMLGHGFAKIRDPSCGGRRP